MVPKVSCRLLKICQSHGKKRWGDTNNLNVKCCSCMSFSSFITGKKVLYLHFSIFEHALMMK